MEVGSVRGARLLVDDDRATIPMAGDGAWDLTRSPLTGTLTYPRPVTPEELAHPALAGAACVTSHWLGFEAFHAGAFAVGDGAWGVLGQKGAGKSTLLASLARRGHSVIADDMVVIDPSGPSIMAGPRCVDLRPDAAEHFSSATLIREDQRRRLDPGEVSPELPFRGWIRLRSGEDFVVERIRPSERISVLSRHRTLPVIPRDPATMIALADLPFFDVGRPFRWDEMDAIATRLVASLAAT